ncbi:MAG: Formamidopyrimidine-DNA glycosylase (EC [uncultured Thiotrichaceae bacterium]|uniref:Formamidopyrimidine-DNA glycosylase n=1 Tax=uncultured Thiotrichaceae bacterium TaxID=298394 RepID=A0A6S6S912_9GAMM|nr:MAG: Formamidopyrimidine-DNA glycosylase (EC [uncultured Thiotrichaceae bacterium]
MPELPEVETTRRGIEPHIKHETISAIVVRQPKLRWPVPEALQQLVGRKVDSVERRAKYLRLVTDAGEAIIHLGMSGSLRVCDADALVEKHDHVDFCFGNGAVLRLRDPRRFGAVLMKDHREVFPLFRKLGPEPLGDEFTVDTLFEASRNRKVTVKQLIMDGYVVVGVGNIYASESLFMSKINPKTQANKISYQRYVRLTESIKQVLARAIEKGGTTLKDFVSADGQTGYFQIELQVYGREGEPCQVCKKPIKQISLGQRSTFYCGQCQR